jgi:hypothetical protein
MPHQFGGQVAVSGPGGQVNPAMMGGMPPGANPNAHAIQHLSPAQQQMFQQQQQQMQGQCTFFFGQPPTLRGFPALSYVRDQVLT